MKYRQPGYRTRTTRKNGKSGSRMTRVRAARASRAGWRARPAWSRAAISAASGAGSRQRPDRCSLPEVPCGPALLPQLRALRSGARFECRQPIPKRVPSKTAANTCEFFKPETVLDATGRRIVSRTGRASG